MPYNIILYFRLPYFHVSNSALFLHSTPVLSFYIDVVLTLSINMFPTCGLEVLLCYLKVLKTLEEKNNSQMLIKYDAIDVGDKLTLWLNCCHLVIQKPVVSFCNSFLPSDAIWLQRSGSTMAQVMACCLTAPSHDLNQCWLIIKCVSGFVMGAIKKGIWA